MLENANIVYTKLPVGIEKHSRFSEDCRYDFYLNCSDKPVAISGVSGLDLLTGKDIDKQLTLEKYGVAVIKNKF
jgi:beta-galactosidase